MPTFEITSPDGRKFRVTGPDGATKQDALDQVRARVTSEDIKNEGAGQYLSETAKNIPGSAVKAGKDIYQTIAHPVQTVENLGFLAKGISQKLGLSSGKDSIQYADAAWNYLKDRYGSAAAIKKSFHDDPVGVLLDASTVLGGAELTGVKTAGTVARAIDPLAAVGRVGTSIVKNAVAPALGVTTGAGTDAIRMAAQAGAQGGEAGQAFRSAMRGDVTPNEIVSSAQTAVSNLRKQRGDEYVKNMSRLGADKTVLDFGDIDKAVENTVSKFKGQTTNPSVEAVQSQIRSIVEDWKKLDPKEYHTAEGLDALKKKVGDIKDNTPYDSPNRVAADKVYNAIRAAIVKQAPEYAKTMKAYESASDQIKEIEKTLSVNPRASVDTALRKILTSLRDNVNTNYGKRRELVEFLARNGAKNLLQKAAGLSLSSAAPRGLARTVASGEGLGAIVAFFAGHPALAATVAAGVGASSPAIVGGAAYGLGAASRLPIRQGLLGSRLLGSTGSQ